ncbi:hypothetical protein QOZ80_4BG0359890 [Eleusine coracana subsp. coracana]|nr:hypothetical protein QOZ80_4BG0359890 [Eleusine coracana subsp. coracana]
MAHYRPQAIVQIHLVIVFCSLLPSPLSAFTTNHTVSAPSVQCLPDQVSALIRLKRSFVTTDYSVIAFRSWRVGTDCCHWEGIRCDQEDGRVTSLDLGYCGLESSRLDPVVFELTSLRADSISTWSFDLVGGFGPILQ